jgi:hypothetical protein
MKEYRDDFEAFFLSEIGDIFHGKTEGQSYESLVDNYVLAMGVDFSHPMITALCRKLHFSVLIIDPKIGAQSSVNILDSSGASGTFCRNGEHYFVLYTPEEALPIPVPVIPLPSHQLQPTEMMFKCKIPIGHTLFIRGSGNGLSWEKSSPLTPIDEDTWSLHSHTPLEDMEYKFRLDDALWEDGDNHKMVQGKIDEAHPRFTLPPSSRVEMSDTLSKPIRTTQITVKFDTELKNGLSLCGNGPGMNWEKGIELRNIGHGVWAFETQSDFENFEYKIVFNGKWEDGDNHKIDCGKKEEIAPKFSNR